MTFTAIAVHSMRIVAYTQEALAAIAGVDKAIGACAQNGLVFIVGAAIELIVMVAVFLVRQGAILSLTVRLIVVQGRDRRLPWTLRPYSAGDGLLNVVVVVIVAGRCPVLSTRFVVALKLSKDRSCRYYKSISLVSEKVHYQQRFHLLG